MRVCPYLVGALAVVSGVLAVAVYVIVCLIRGAANIVGLMLGRW